MYNTLPFGWSPRAYIYHTTSLGATHFIRSNGAPASQYIDDRHVGQLRLPQGCLSNWSDLDLVKATSFWSLVAILLALKSQFCLHSRSDSQKQAFILPEDKKQKFAALRNSHFRLRWFRLKVCKSLREGGFIFAGCSSCETVL